jgi:hypothetical protein
MKRFAIVLTLVLAFCNAGHAVISMSLDAPGDDPDARREAWYEPELEPFRANYQQFIETRFLPLKLDDVKRILGPRLSRKPDDMVLPLCMGFGIMISGGNRFTALDRSHIDLHTVGPSGFVQCFYQLNGTNLEAAVFYFRKDPSFVPLKSATNFTERLEWEEGKFRAMERWLGEHLPKVHDLGVVEVLATGATRVNLGAGATCIIDTLPNSRRDDSYRFSIEVQKDTTNRIERFRSSRVKDLTRTNQLIGFSSEGKFYRIVPKFVEQLQKTNTISVPLL